jgi:hypothetical protein
MAALTQAGLDASIRVQSPILRDCKCKFIALFWRDDRNKPGENLNNHRHRAQLPIVCPGEPLNLAGYPIHFQKSSMWGAAMVQAGVDDHGIK